METSLHRDLKTLYAGTDAQFEVSLGDYRSTWATWLNPFM